MPKMQGEPEGILVFPGELIQQIFGDTCISRDDLKALRLLCRSVTGVATKLLFYRICISKLKTDRHAFLNVATSPHLAGAVRVLAWYELADNELGINASNSMDIYADLVTQIRDAFWIPTRNLHETDATDETLEMQTAAIEEFRPHFYAALDAMPSLQTIITQPMHPYRLLTKSPSCYPLTAQLPQCGMKATQLEMNDGFYSLLGPAMARRATTNTPITRLHFADEGHSTSLIRLHPDFLPAFAPLTHIDLCISNLNSPLDLDCLGACLRAATNLTHLRLCSERSTAYFHHGRQIKADIDIDALLCHPAAHWVRLYSLRLDHLSFPTASLLSFAKRHANSLRRLRIDGCSPTAGALAGLAGIDGLRLNRFVAQPSSAFELNVNIPEAHILAFVNSGGADGLNQAVLQKFPSDHVYTHAAAFDPNGWATGAICDTRGRVTLRLGYSVSEVVALDAENGDVRDGDGFTFEEGGCWEMPFERGPPEMNGALDEHDEYTREQVSHLKRWREAPRWMWGRGDDGKGDVYYWEAGPDDGVRGVGYLTEMWRFEHRSGEVAFGDDPLEFWEDWEGSEAGDVSEATPFGKEFRSYLLGQQSGRSSPNPWGPGHRVPVERAVKYHEGQEEMYLSEVPDAMYEEQDGVVEDQIPSHKWNLLKAL